jgi:hypothetical protein
VHGDVVVEDALVVWTKDAARPCTGRPELLDFLCRHVRVVLLELDGVTGVHGVWDLVEELCDEVHGDALAQLLIDPGRSADGEHEEHDHPIDAQCFFSRHERPARYIYVSGGLGLYPYKEKHKHPIDNLKEDGKIPEN